MFLQIVDPWGKVLADAKEDVGIITAEINLDQISTVRKKMPVYQHQRPELYENTSLQPKVKVPSSNNDEESFPFGQVSVKYKHVFLENNHARAFVNKKCVAPGRK